MFRLSRKGEYAIRTVLHLSLRGDLCTTEEIATIQGVPEQFLKKIIQSLRIAGVINSTKGKNGGISLIGKPSDVSVWKVIESVEGPIFLNDCLICGGTCPRDQICPVHEMWKKLQSTIKEQLEATNFDALARRHHKLVARSKESGVPYPESVALIIDIPPEKLDMSFAE